MESISGRVASPALCLLAAVVRVHVRSGSHPGEIRITTFQMMNGSRESFCDFRKLFQKYFVTPSPLLFLLPSETPKTKKSDSRFKGDSITLALFERFPFGMGLRVTTKKLNLISNSEISRF